MEWIFLLLALELPAVIGLLDCYNRLPAEFDDGDEGRRSWIRLWVAVATSWFLVGNAILLGYYYNVVKRRTPLGRG